MADEASSSNPNVSDGRSERELKMFWDKRLEKVNAMPLQHFRELGKHLELPLARIKKIMRLDENAEHQMISSEAPMLLSTAAEYLIEEMTLRAWIHTEQNRRKTIQKSDVAAAVAGNEVFDFLIDIIPREEVNKQKPHVDNQPRQQANDASYQYYYDGHPLIQLDDGQFIQATQIGPSIPLSAAPGQPIQVVTMDGGEQFQIVPVHTSDS
uniref:Transcription factor CBF/NF-Y/archaeal histone domain-containing protein n=1 Tax=Panagrolaimus superbus TaxID=310955 RepID=A0A914Z1F8_9BILA